VDALTEGDMAVRMAPHIQSVGADELMLVRGSPMRAPCRPTCRVRFSCVGDRIYSSMRMSLLWDGQLANRCERHSRDTGARRSMMLPDL
jgi:hypothetical protein